MTVKAENIIDLYQTATEYKNWKKIAPAGVIGIGTWVGLKAQDLTSCEVLSTQPVA